MKRGIFDVLRRGFDNALVNWPLIAIRIAEMIVLGVLSVVAALAIVVPIFVSIGIEFSNIQTPDDIIEATYRLMQQWVLLVWIFVAASVALLVFVAVHSFVEAGSARVYVDAERIAGPENVAPRSRFRVFSMERWWAGGRDGWWTVFWIYNLAWGLAGLILLIPLIPTLVLTLLFRESPPVAMTAGCLGLILTMLLMMLVAIVTGMWTNRAIADWAVHRSGASATLSGAWSAMKADIGRHLLIALAVFVVAMAGSSFFASFSFLATMGDSLHRTMTFNMVTMPIRFFASLLSWIFSAMVSAWALAAYSSLAVEKPSE